MLRLSLLCAAGLACTPPTRPPLPAEAPAPGDRSEAPGPEAPVPQDSPAPTPPAASTLPAIALPQGSGLRVVLEARAWDTLAVPGHVVTVEPDLLHLAARDAATGAEKWRVQVQQRAEGWHTLFGLDDQAVLLAGQHRIHVDLATGAVRGTRRGFFHGVDKGCSLELTSGDRTAHWSTWIPSVPAGTACAQSCGCSLSVFDCSGATDRAAAFHSQTTHLYRSLREPHDTVCFKEPALLARGDRHLVVRVEDDKHNQIVAGLDATTFDRAWTRRDLGELLETAGVDPSGRLCWLGDDARLVAFACATGATRWQLRLGDGVGARLEARWQTAHLLVQHRDMKRTHVELRDDRAARRWQRTLPADRYAVLPGEPLDRYYVGGADIQAIAILDPATGATLGEIPVPGDELLLTVPGGYLRVAGGAHQEFDTRGKPTRAATRADVDPVVHVATSHVVTVRAEQLRVLHRATLAPALTLPGRWALREATAALGPDVLVLQEHRDREAPRVLVLRP